MKITIDNQPGTAKWLVSDKHRQGLYHRYFIQEKPPQHYGIVTRDNSDNDGYPSFPNKI